MNDDGKQPGGGPVRPPMPQQQDLTPCDITEEEFGEFVAWLEHANREEAREVIWDFAGATEQPLLAVIALWLYPERYFEEPWWMELEERHGGPMWVDDFKVNSTVLNSDMENWVRVSRVEEHLRDTFGYDITDVRAAGHVLNLVTRGLAKLAEEPGPGELDPDWWFRLDWATIVTWWRGTMKRRAGQFEPDGYVYLLGGGGYFKIGRTKSVIRRLNQLAIQLPWPVSVEHVIPCEEHIQAEQALHQRFADKRTHGEWFELDEHEVRSIKSIERMRGESEERRGEGGQAGE